MVQKPLKISSKAVELGMYICKLDRPWQQTPFVIEGFFVRDLNEIKQLGVHCNYVFIDTQKGVSPSSTDEVKITSGIYRGKLNPIKPNSNAYQLTIPIKKEMVVAQTIYHDLLNELTLVVEQVSDRNLSSLTDFTNAAYAMVDSIVRNPDAFLWLVRVRKMDEDPCYYLLRSASWAILFGRHLGLPKSDLRALAISLLLRDIGALHLPKLMREKGLLKEGTMGVDPEVGKMILDNTIVLLRPFSDVPPKAIKTIKMQYERLNGSGFPCGLKGDEIFLLSKISGIAQFYDEVSYTKGNKCAIAISKAVSKLYAVRGSLFQDDLVVEFIKAIGLYPTGTLVEISTGEIAVVVEQNYKLRLKPKVLLLIDEHGNERKKYEVLDLFEDNQRKQALIDTGKKSIREVEKIDILQDVEPYDYPIKVNKIRHHFIDKNRKKSFLSIFSS